MTPAQVSATRRLIGLTADQLGKELDINPRTIRGWESGKYTPSESAATALRELRHEHDAELDGILSGLSSDTVRLSDGNLGRGWTLAIAARLIDRRPDLIIEWV